MLLRGVDLSVGDRLDERGGLCAGHDGSRRTSSSGCSRECLQRGRSASPTGFSLPTERSLLHSHARHVRSSSMGSTKWARRNRPAASSRRAFREVVNSRIGGALPVPGGLPIGSRRDRHLPAIAHPPLGRCAYLIGANPERARWRVCRSGDVTVFAYITLRPLCRARRPRAPGPHRRLRHQSGRRNENSTCWPPWSSAARPSPAGAAA